MNRYFNDIIKLIIFIAVFLGISAGIYFLISNIQKKSGIPKKDIQMEMELKLRDLIKENNDIKYKIINNEYVNESITKIKNKLVNYIDNNPYDIEIIVIDSPIVNAVTFPGGLIVVYSGLLKILDSPEQLAAVLAHEMGHVVNKDPLNAVIRQFGLSVLSNIITGGNPDVLNQIILTLVDNTFSREQEAKADDFAAKLLIKSKINPKHLTEVFEKLKAEQKQIIDKNIMKYISTHPDIDNRINVADKKAKDFKGVEKKIDVDWDKLKKNLPNIFN